MLRNIIVECKVIEARHYSSDLPQGGLEVPCTLRGFSGDANLGRSYKASAIKILRYIHLHIYGHIHAHAYTNIHTQRYIHIHRHRHTV